MKSTILLLLFSSLFSFGQQQSLKTVDELINREDPGWPVIETLLDQATNEVEVLVKDSDKARKTLEKVQVTTRSLMGAVIYETGGILIDHGWIRLLGSGSERLNRDIANWNKGKSFVEFGDYVPFYLIADDILGGFFALNGGGLGPDMGKVYYFSPDMLEWEQLNMGYSEFIWWLFTGDLAMYYEPYRWDGWEKEITELNGEQGYTYYPFLWAKYESFSELVRGIVPMEELWNFQIYAREFFLEK